MLNDSLALLSDYPFDRLRALLDGIEPPAGPTVVMSIGEPQHSAPPILADILAANADQWGRYPPSNGTVAFRTAVVEWLTRRFGLPATFLDPERHVLPVAGTREALYMIAQVALPEHKGGNRPCVLLPNPFYQVYYGAAVMNHGQPVFVQDFTQAAPHVLEQTALAYVCTPANPEGTVASLDTLKQAVMLARHHGFVLAVDECYSEIYDRDPPPGALQACAELGHDLSNVIVFHSLSKRSSVPGLRSGFVAGDPRIISAFARLRAYGGAATPLPVLTAATALWRDEAHVDSSRSLYRAKIDAAERILGGKFDFRRPAGSFFLWLNVGDGELAAKALWREAGIRVLPGAYLAQAGENRINPGHPFIRVALVHDLGTTITALQRIHDIL
ncbi:MAG: aminotransferase class I/II-fold pyridoxal phosphate-dependent enzyme [Alphaproteobacteria bacterium]|nr:aminotransferase class I/II-fold pyridoxal phosphate-dependent enzyme [Alphaproteobacteria bacterium]